MQNIKLKYKLEEALRANSDYNFETITLQYYAAKGDEMRYPEKKRMVLEMVYPIIHQPTAPITIKNPEQYAWDNYWDTSTPFYLHYIKTGHWLISKRAFEIGRHYLGQLLKEKYLDKPFKYISVDTMLNEAKTGLKACLYKYGQNVYTVKTTANQPLSTEYINRVKGSVAFLIKVRDKPYICFPMHTQRIVDCTHIEDITYILKNEQPVPAWLEELTFSDYDVQTYDYPLFEHMKNIGNNTVRGNKDALPGDLDPEIIYEDYLEYKDYLEF